MGAPAFNRDGIASSENNRTGPVFLPKLCELHVPD